MTIKARLNSSGLSISNITALATVIIDATVNAIEELTACLISHQSTIPSKRNAQGKNMAALRA